MVGCRGRGTEIEEPEEGVGGYGAEEGGRGGMEGCGVGAGVGGEVEERSGAVGGPLLYK